MSRTALLNDAQWAQIEPLMPSSDGSRGRPFREHRQIVEGIIYRFRTGIAWRDLPPSFGPWQTVWKRHRRFSHDGTWDRIHARLMSQADAAGDIDWTVSVDSPSPAPTNMPRTSQEPRAPQGAESNDRSLREEPPDHAIGRSRGGLTTKTHQLVDTKKRPLVILLSAGQAGDSPILKVLLSHLAVQ